MHVRNNEGAEGSWESWADNFSGVRLLKEREKQVRLSGRVYTAMKVLVSSANLMGSIQPKSPSREALHLPGPDLHQYSCKAHIVARSS